MDGLILVGFAIVSVSLSAIALNRSRTKGIVH
jgi:hypothetical protein